MHVDTQLDETAALAALQWYLDHGVDEAIADVPQDAFALFAQEKADKQTPQPSPDTTSSSAPTIAAAPVIQSTSALLKQAVQAANQADTLEALQQAITTFDGLEIKTTASQAVFASGLKTAEIMVIFDAPLADDDREGQPLLGRDGVLFDKALACINRTRTGQTPEDSLYIAPLLNWRPPGGRTPTPEEIALSLPFLERHISLIQPKILLILGAGAAQALLGKSEGISRLRKHTFTYTTRTQGLTHCVHDIPVITTYAPGSVLNTPLQKQGLWHDLLKLKHHEAIVASCDKKD